MIGENKMEKQISTGLKIWLWVVIVFNGLSAISNLTKIGQSPLGSIISILLEAALIYSCVLIMFQMKKLGFKLMCITAGVNAVVSVLIVILAGAVAGAVAGSATVGIAGGLVGAVLVVIIAAICPLITYFLMKPQWDVFE